MLKGFLKTTRPLSPGHWRQSHHLENISYRQQVWLPMSEPQMIKLVIVGKPVFSRKDPKTLST